MSFIAVTYGYNQFSIFNTNTSTQTLVDNIKHVTLNQIIATLSQKDSELRKTIDSSSSEEENLKKTIILNLLINRKTTLMLRYL